MAATMQEGRDLYYVAGYQAGLPHQAHGAPQIQFDALFRDVNAQLISYVRQRAPRALVDDIVAETWTTVWRRWEALPADPSERRGWVFVVARKITGRAVFVASREIPVDEFVESAGVRENDPLARHISAEAIEGLLAALSTAERQAFGLYVLSEMSIKEIADELRCSVSSVTTRLDRARRHAKHYLASLAAGEAAQNIPGIKDVKQ